MTDETRDLIVINTGSIQTYAQNPALELAIAAWLDAKGNRSGSERTKATYRDFLLNFRAALQEKGLDLDGDTQAIATLAQAWCGYSLKGKKVSPATFNQRRSVLSSFYAFARKRGFLSSNPLELVDGQTTQEYRSARPLNKDAVNNALHAIDRSTLPGMRDYALLSILLTTGRRVNELVSLYVGDLSLEGDTLVITWRRTKGNKTMQDEIQPHVANVLIRYLMDVYGAALASINPAYPVWVRLDNHNKHKQPQDRPLAHDGVALICEKHLKTSKVHTTRHTFAHAMSEVGAKPEEIQAKLGHSSLQVTGRYLAALNSAKNVHAGKVASLFGLDGE